MIKKKKKKIKYRTIDRLKNYKSDNHFRVDSSKVNDNFNNSTKSIQNLIGNLNLKKNENYIRLTSSQLPKKIMNFLDNSDDPIQKYLDIILNEINNINFDNNNNDIKNKTIYNYNPKNNLINEEKNMINDINIFLYKMSDDSKNIKLLNTTIKNINNIIKEKMGGIYLGWGESEHNEFLVLKKFYQDKSNSYIFLASLNNLFPYKAVSDLKKHIKLNEIYTKIEKIRGLIIEKYTQMKNKFDIDKSRISKQTSTSVTKSCCSNKPKYNHFRKRYKMSIDFEDKNPLYFNTNTKFFNIDRHKKNSDVKTFCNKSHKSNKSYKSNKSFKSNKSINRTKSGKNEKIVEYKKFCSISVNHSKDKMCNNSYNMLKKGKLKQFVSLYNEKNGYNY